jgi:hypothetical protein
VKSFYKTLGSQVVVSFPLKSIWCVKTPSWMSFFVWSVALGKVLMHGNLCRLHIVVVEWCYMCKKSVKSIEHFLLHCDVARDI